MLVSFKPSLVLMPALLGTSPSCQYFLFYPTLPSLAGSPLANSTSALFHTRLSCWLCSTLRVYCIFSAYGSSLWSLSQDHLVVPHTPSSMPPQWNRLPQSL